MVLAKISQTFLLAWSLNHLNTTLFVVFENIFFHSIRNWCHFVALIFISTSLNHANRTVFGLFRKIPEKQKRPWPQTNDRRFLVRLAWQSRSPGYFIDLLRYIGFRPTTSAGTFPTVRIHSSVIWSVPACLCFHSTTFPRVLQQKLPLINPNKTATHVDKTETNRAFCYLHRTFLYLSALVWWESGFVCQRRSAILI